MILTRQQALERGVRPRDLRTHWTRLYHGVYASSGTPLTLATLVAGARLVLPPDAVPTGLTALQLRGLDLGPHAPVTFAHPARLEARGIQVVRVRRVPDRRGLAKVSDSLGGRRARPGRVRGGHGPALPP